MSKAMCERCGVQPATVFISQVTVFISQVSAVLQSEAEAEAPVKHEFCSACADAFHAERNEHELRNLITLTSEYRARLLDKLERECPDAFYMGDDPERAEEASVILWKKLESQFKADKLDLGQTATAMLIGRLIGSNEFYQRAEKLNRGESQTSSVKFSAEFLNVDLQIWSDEPLGPLLDALEAETTTLYHGKNGDLDFAILELFTAPDTPERGLRRFAELVQTLQGDPAQIWRNARKVFSIGFAGALPFEYRFSSAELTLATSMQALLEVAVYESVGG